MIKQRGNGEATVQKAITVVKQTLELMHEPQARLFKMQQAAGKINNPKQKAYQLIWDVSYLHQYVHESPVPGHSNVIGYIERAILLVRGLTGWRSADLLGLYAEHSFNFVDDHRVTKAHGVYVSVFNTKAKKHRWSAPVFFPRLYTNYASLCLYRLFRDFQVFIDTLDVHQEEIVDKKGNKVLATPLFICQKGSRKKFKQMAEGTVRNYFKRAFLDNVTDQADQKYGDAFAAHSSRHAVASALAEMGTSALSISSLTLNSAATLEQTYIMPVQRTWQIPRSCAMAQENLLARLLTPYVHWHSTQGDKQDCGCKGMLQQVPAPTVKRKRKQDSGPARKLAKRRGRSDFKTSTEND